VSIESPVVNELQPLELLASALSGRALQVAHAARGESTWTDGKTVFIDATLNDREQLIALIVQASLLSAGSLTANILHGIARRPRVLARYLAIEGHRALANNEPLLPPFMRSVLDKKIAVCCDSSERSKKIALSSEAISDPPLIFGVIRASRLLAANLESERNSHAKDKTHNPHQQRQALAELEEDDAEDDNGSSSVVDMFTVPGGGGVIGRWLQRLFKAVRQGTAGGSPGIDAATHRAGLMKPRRGLAVFSTAALNEEVNLVKKNGGIKYPEWDVHNRHYRQEWCTVHEIVPPLKVLAQLEPPDPCGLRRPLARIGLGLSHCRRQVQGDDIDIDAAIEARIEVLAGSIPDENVYVDSLRRRRDLSVLILLDISGSATEQGVEGKTVHEQQRSAAAALAFVLHNLGDRVALYAFNSQGRSSVQLVPVKHFDDQFNSLTMQRLYSLEPGAYSRLGAAIRHGAAVLEEQGGTSKRILLVLSDGLAYDHGYERDYGAADARCALGEARRRGTGGLCLTIGASTDAESLRRVFGNAAHATISQSSQLGNVIGRLFQSALRSAEVRRQVS